MNAITEWDEEGGGVMVGAKVEPLTQDDYDALISGRNVIVRHKAATLAMRWTSLRGFNGIGTSAMPKEPRFVMSGPSGLHSLLVVSTPLERLNAHWRVFASHSANQGAA